MATTCRSEGRNNMKRFPRVFTQPALATVALLVIQIRGLAAGEPPTEWIEPATGHRVIRLSREPGSSSFYFHQNGYTADGDKLILATPSGLSALDLKTRKLEQIVEGRADQVVVGRKTRQVFYVRQDNVYATQIDTHGTRLIATLPRNFRRGSGLTVNADETLLAGSLVESAQPGNSPTSEESTQPGSANQRKPSAAEGSLERRWAARLPMCLDTIDVKTGELKTFHHSTDWLNHVQFSPTDPTLLTFCHEGPWHKVHRIWTIRTDGSDVRKIHNRTMDMEIAGHEFFSADGRIIWYDLQTPKGQEFWLAGVAFATDVKIRYKVERDQWSVHYNVSPDGTLFCGDGGGPHSVAAPGNGQWIYLFRPENGKLKGEKLVDLAKHDYKLEPNCTFTPDGKWIIFRSNMHGPSHVYAVEVAKAQSTASH
jgi:oligogalacturonide lyase